MHVSWTVTGCWWSNHISMCCYTSTRWTRTVWYVMWHTARWKSFNIKRLFHRNWTWPTFESCTCHLCVVDPRGWRSTMWFAVCTVMCWCVDGTMLRSFWVDTYADSACDCAAGLGAIRLQTGGVCRGLLDPRTFEIYLEQLVQVTVDGTIYFNQCNGFNIYFCYIMKLGKELLLYYSLLA